ncbi:hypothetical protein TWF102_004602 [Orbilia oligospora]|uniref:Calcium uniporter protein n=1 Tax=Orbilia oligospora TaxID=2813651 RepID=A0A7C8JW91_ORBOL|nr:hypothetical protein TWF103_008043 [Orbilia oligospora]KAF3102402.1 hypothetical protein TWF102_004602 [Orbilia oligospora]KAF3122388.1 hypothetical protein TWF703_001415 [Orbilia oligospora]
MRHSIVRSMLLRTRHRTQNFQTPYLGHITHHQPGISHGQLWRSFSAHANLQARQQVLHGLTAKLTSTPSRLFKLILPLPAVHEDGNQDRSLSPKETEHYEKHPPSSLSKPSTSVNHLDQKPKHLALLIHPNQPLSHLAQLIQSQLPTLKSGRVPSVNFYRPLDTPPPKSEVIAPSEDEVASSGGEGAPKSAQGRDVDDEEESLVLWSGSTEIGDFVRDAAVGHEEEEMGLQGGFVIDIEGTVDKSGVWVSVPSFNDRTVFLRKRYKSITKEIEGLVELKEKCDKLAQKTAQHMALGGFGAMIGWWGLVYFLTFNTSLGWDTMEPVTYLAGLSGIMAGYLWFLYHNREVSYRSVLHATISRRQLALYDQHGFDMDRWQELLDEGRSLRREIKIVAEEYGVRWDGKADSESSGDFGVVSRERKKRAAKVEEVLKKEEEKTENGKHSSKKEDGDDH